LQAVRATGYIFPRSSYFQVAKVTRQCDAGGTVAGGHNLFSQFKAKPVSPFFRFDWNYALKVARFPVIRPASIVISLMPILADVMNWLSVYIANVWLLWTASICFLAGYCILKVRAPPFIQEYQFYSQYEGLGHSHRWIVWQFYHNLRSLSGWEQIVRETKQKLLSLRCDRIVDLAVCRLSPVFGLSRAQPIEVAAPIQVDRDIYLPIRVGDERIVLPMQESDPELPLKQKELFWILLTQCAKERPLARSIVWLFFGVSLLLYLLTVINNVVRVALGDSLFSVLGGAMRKL
jgi:hypothetical protein